MIYLKTIKLPGFRLYNVNYSYPAAVKTFDNDDMMLIDLFDLDEEVYDAIVYMKPQQDTMKKS